MTSLPVPPAPYGRGAMAVCSFFLQGRCRFGERCWNEHPRGGGYRGSSNQKYVQPSSFSKSTTWTRDDNRSTFNSPSGSSDHRSRNFNSGPSYTQNQFSALSPQDQSGDTQSDKDGSLLEDIKRDFEAWESSGQWILSVYCALKEKRNLTGFADISPEELRLEFYTAQNAGNLQNYVNSVQQLTSQWKQRLHEIRNMSPSSQAALINDLTRPITAAAPIFGGQQNSGFGMPNPSIGTAAPSDINFSFKADAQSTSMNTASLSSFPSAPGLGNKPTSGFGNAVMGSAASFSFAGTTSSEGAGPGNAGAVSAALFSFAPTTPSSVGPSAFSGFASAATAQPMGTPSTFPAGFGGATTSTDFGGSAGAAPAFGGSAGAASAFGGSVGAVPAFGGSAGAAPAFGSASGTSVFGAFANTVTTGFGAKPTAVSDLFKAGTVSSTPSTLFGQLSGVSVSQTQSTTAASTASVDPGNDDPLFTPRSGLSAEELSQFESKKFTLMKIPRPPPPVDLLLV